MPPKKKGKKGKGSALIDGVDTSSMTREQLEGFAHRLKNELEREREERNFFQLERDKLRTFWDITRNQLDDAKATIRNKNRDVEIANETADVDIKHVVQQMKHLQYENQTKIGEIRAEGMTQLKLAQEDHGLQEQELLRDKRDLRRQLREKEEMKELQIQELKMLHSDMLSRERAKFDQEAQEMTVLHENKLQKYKEEAEIRHRMEMFEVEERKNIQVANLIEAHDQSFKDMKNYYNDITLNNLALISSLKEQMEELRKLSSRSERLAMETRAENKRLTDPFKEAQTEVVELRKKLEYYEKDKGQLARIKTKYTVAVKELRELKWETEALHMKTQALTDQRDQLLKKFEDATFELQQKCGVRSVLLERKVNMLQKEAEQREAVLSEALNISGVKSSQIGVGVEALLQAKTDKIQDLSYELARVAKAHDDLLASYEAKMIQFGIPKEELGFEPLRTSNQFRLGSGPAGLVTRNP